MGRVKGGKNKLLDKKGRLKSFKWIGNYFIFESSKDLSIGILVIPLTNNNKIISLDNYSSDLILFIEFYTRNFLVYIINPVDLAEVKFAFMGLKPLI